MHTSIGHFRLHHRRRGQRRLPARQPAVADPRSEVLLLEAGGQDDWFWIDIPVGYLYTIANPRTDWCYKTAARRAPRRPLDPLRARPRARRLLLDQRHDLHARAEGGLRPLGLARQPRLVVGRRAAALQEARGLSARRRSTCTAPAASCASRTRACAGTSSTPGATPPQSAASRRSKVFNRGDNFGSAYFQMNQKRGVRWSATKAFLRPALHRGRTSPSSRTRSSSASALAMGRTAACRGVEFAHPRDGRCFAQARARNHPRGRRIGSPQLLQLSGVGPADLLARTRHRAGPRPRRASARTCTTTCRSACSTR